jgi:hypothetical protein
MQTVSAYIFAVALILLIISLSLVIAEIRISAKSLEIYLGDMNPLTPKGE